MEFKFNKIIIIKEFLVTQLNHWSFFPIYFSISMILGGIASFEKPYVLRYALLGIIPFLLYLVRCNVHKIWQLALCHIGLILPFVLLPYKHIYYTVVFIGIVLIYFIISWTGWGKNNNQNKAIYAPFSVSASIVFLFLLNKQGYENYELFFIIPVIIELAVYFIIYYIEQYFKFLSVNNSSASHIPAKDMLKSGGLLVALYTAISISIILFVSTFGWLKNILAIISKGLKALLKTILNALPNGSDTIVTVNPDEAQQQMIDAMMFETEDVPTFWLWVVIEKALMAFFVIGILILLIVLILKIYSLIRMKLSIKSESISRLNENMTEVREKIEVESNKSGIKLNPFKSMSASERIRHIYKKLLVANKEHLIGSSDISALSNLTAKEASNKLSKDFFYVYEKARYSNLECNAEDVKKMKEACK